MRQGALHLASVVSFVHALGACGGSEPGAGGPRFELTIAPLQLPGIGVACYDVRVETANDTVWSNVNIVGNALLEDLGGLMAFTVIGNLALVDLPNVSSLAAVAMKPSGSLNLTDLPQVTDLTPFAGLETLSGDLTIVGLGVTSLAGFGGLATAANVIVAATQTQAVNVVISGNYNPTD